VHAIEGTISHLDVLRCGISVRPMSARGSNPEPSFSVAECGHSPAAPPQEVSKRDRADPRAEIRRSAAGCRRYFGDPSLADPANIAVA
jgi:hypothetical protein